MNREVCEHGVWIEEEIPCKKCLPMDIVDRLILSGDPLSIEAAEKIMKLRARGKFWEKECKKIRVKYFENLANAIKAERKI